MAALTREQALAELDALRERLHARVWPDLPGKGRKYLHYVVDEQINAARMHLNALYAHGLALGPGLTALSGAAAHPKYTFWVEGIRRHLEQCEASLGAAGGTASPGV